MLWWFAPSVVLIFLIVALGQNIVGLVVRNGSEGLRRKPLGLAVIVANAVWTLPPAGWM